MASRREPLPSLPPHEFWLIEPGEKLNTPVDNRGIVDIARTIDLVKSSVDPSYVWSPTLDVHHFEWPATQFPFIHERGRPNPRAFRELPPLKGLGLREFQNFLHEITEPPPAVEEEVMSYYIDAWRVADALFKKSKEVIRLRRKWHRRQAYIEANPHLIAEGFNGQDVIGEEIMQEIFERDFRGLDMYLERNNQIPAEFRFFDSEEPLSLIAGKIGQIAAPRALKIYKAVAA